MRFVPFLALFLLVSCEPVKPDAGNNLATKTGIEYESAAEAAGDVAEIAVNASSNLVFTQENAAKALETTRTIEGETGTLTVAFEREVDADSRTRTRTLTFEDFTGDGKGKGRFERAKHRLSHINGTIVHTFVIEKTESDPRKITRTLQGDLTAKLTRRDGTEVDVTIAIDASFTRDPDTGCATFSGTFKVDGEDIDIARNRDRTRCKDVTNDTRADSEHTEHSDRNG